jgi:transposase
MVIATNRGAATMARGRRTDRLSVTDEDRRKLGVWVRRATTAQRLALRSRIVLLCADGMSDTEVSKHLHITRVTVATWRKRFRAHGLSGMTDQPRPGAPRRISDAKVEEVMTKAFETTPPDATHWSTRSLARAVGGISHNRVAEIWRAFGLKPQLTGGFKLSTDPYFVEKVRDIVGLYLDPPEHAMVLCVDEKSQIQALDRTQPLLPHGLGGYIETRTHDYERHGTTTLFAALSVLDGKVIGNCQKRHRHQEYLKFLQTVDAAIPAELDVHLVVDNYGTHKAPQVQRWFLRHPRYHLHFTPTGASWLNQVERFFAEITRKRIRRGTFRSVKQLEQAIYDYLAHYNQDPRPFRWSATADQILAKVEAICSKINVTGH